METETKTNCKKIFAFIVVSIGLLLLYVFALPRLYSVVLYADDFHYWASGAFWAGYDWSSMVRHDYYYSYGYGFVLAPLFWLTSNGTVLFRLGIILNYLFLILCFGLLIKIGKKLYPTVSVIWIYLAAVLACVYPSWQIHLNSAMCEALLYFLFVLIIYLLVEVQTNDSFIKMLCLGIVTVYIYMVHQRMLVVTIVVSLVVFFLMLAKKIDRMACMDYFLTILGMFGIHKVIKPVYRDFLYINYSTLEINRALELRGILLLLLIKVVFIVAVFAVLFWMIHKKNLFEWSPKNIATVLLLGSLLAIILSSVSNGKGVSTEQVQINNEYSGMIAKLMRVLKGDNFLNFMKTVGGHLFYIFTVSGGMAIYLVVNSATDLSDRFRRKEWRDTDGVKLTISLVTILSVTVSSLFMAGLSGRVDTKIYGRYSEFVMPIVLLIAVLKLKEEGVRWRELWISMVVYATVVYFTFLYYKQGFVLDAITENNFLSINAPGVYWEFANGYNGVLISAAVAVFIVLLWIIVGVVKWSAIKLFLLVIVGVAYIAQGKLAIEDYLLPQQELLNAGEGIVEVINNEEYDRHGIYYMRDPYEAIHSSAYFQMQLPKEHIYSISDAHLYNLIGDSIVVCDIKDEYSQQLLSELGYILKKKTDTAVCYVSSGQPNMLVGEGTEEKPYLIQSYEDLCWFREAVNSGNCFTDKYFKQTVDIDLQGQEWVPIGRFGDWTYFDGDYDGDGHCLENLCITQEENGAFFGVLAGTVRNLGIADGIVEGICSAGIAGHAADSSAQVINCYNKATIIGDYRAGGIVDNFIGTVYNCVNMGKIIGPRIGEIAGHSVAKAVRCYGSKETLFWEETFEGTKSECGVLAERQDVQLSITQLNNNVYWMKQTGYKKMGELCYWQCLNNGIVFAEEKRYSDWIYAKRQYVMRIIYTGILTVAVMGVASYLIYNKTQRRKGELCQG